MSLRSRLLIALSTTLLGSTAASAALVTVTSYEMNNGNGTFSLGTYNYLDGAYVGTSPAANSITEQAPLTGGKASSRMASLRRPITRKGRSNMSAGSMSTRSSTFF